MTCSVGKFVGPAIDMIWFGIAREANRIDRVSTREKSFHNTVHSVEDATARVENNRVRKIGLLDELHMVGDCPASRRVLADMKPVVLVELRDFGEWNENLREVPRMLDEPVYVPGEQAAR